MIRLDHKPPSWEEKTYLFIADLVDRGLQSQSVKTYVSAIKRVLTNDDYQWNDNKVLLGSLVKATRLINDRVKTRLPIQHGLLELILFETQRVFKKKNQFYLELLYKAIFALGYYGLMRAGELLITNIDEHTVKAKNIHMAENKEKLLIVLYSSKTHGIGNVPQKIKITSNRNCEQSTKQKHKHFCPFAVINHKSLSQSETRNSRMKMNLSLFSEMEHQYVQIIPDLSSNKFSAT